MTVPAYQSIASLFDTINIQPESIVNRPIFTNTHLRAVLFAFAAGQELSEHTAAVPAIIQILSGTAHMTLGDDAFDVQPHAWVYMAAKQPHSIKATTDMVMLLTLLKPTQETGQAER